ncbi:hypothetical protein PABG_02219 [Paracoccidioides brasiliensis Pb03]|nr:hypothetical protein PABG_02219 [Paracoccidioides brasiliensis Pb03]
MNKKKLRPKLGGGKGPPPACFISVLQHVIINSAAATERLDPAPSANEQPCFTRKEWRRELKRRPSQPTPAISPRLPSLM